MPVQPKIGFEGLKSVYHLCWGGEAARRAWMRATLERAYEDSLSAYARAQQEPPSVVQHPYVEPLGVARLRAAAGLFDAPAPAPPVRRKGKEPEFTMIAGGQ